MGEIKFEFRNGSCALRIREVSLSDVSIAAIKLLHVLFTYLDSYTPEAEITVGEAG